MSTSSLRIQCRPEQAAGLVERARAAFPVARVCGPYRNRRREVGMVRVDLDLTDPAEPARPTRQEPPA